MDPTTEFEIDTMILDYICSKAILETITKRAEELAGRPPIEETNILTLFDTWKTLSSTKHAERQISRDLQAKLQLITVAVLFVYRFRKSKWSAPRPQRDEQHGDTASVEVEDTDFQVLLNNVEIPLQERAADRYQMTSLLDILPDFKKLCAMLSNILSPETCMHLAARFMLQSVLEQHVVFGKVSTDLIEDSFSWQSADHPWSNVRSSYLAILQPPAEEESRLEAHIARVAQQFPAFEFEAMIIARLREILDELETPMLVKLETGQLGDWDPSSFRLSNIGPLTQLQRESSTSRQDSC
ncbi:uncharacterized protein TRUGW13939_11576 [Talaromyces rugulosus]|uniref:Uncharacterized protein n=1 Tax=Talaromyces rugulosus TaxID=121627 RepID=A0A7H8RD37_TALRU|nr:uncharacterized protein TRUGW13939_11576 [Talaromyces rugulosus]QKX64402.1 hypothetical protein TRUGW13939_11576 [Talaromyces rugulosus]